MNARKALYQQSYIPSLVLEMSTSLPIAIQLGHQELCVSGSEASALLPPPPAACARSSRAWCCSAFEASSLLAGADAALATQPRSDVALHIA